MTAADHVANDLRVRILQGDLPAGARLNQASIAEQLGVSRIPVRDALQHLQTEGLVTMQGRSGAVVTTMSTADLQEIYELTEALEPLACRLATPNAGRAELLRMQHFHEVMMGLTDKVEWLDANARFHGTLYRSCHRPRLVEMLSGLRSLKDRYLLLYLDIAENTEQLHDQHARLIDAVQSRDLAAVEEVTLEHLHTSHHVLVRHLMGTEMQ